MGTSNTSPPVSNEERLMRRVPAKAPFFYRHRPAEAPLGVTLMGFKPRDNETDGISLSRMQSEDHPEFLTVEQFAARACSGKPPDKHFYVAILAAKELCEPTPTGLGLELKPDPVDGDPGHVVIPQLHYGMSDETRNSFTLTLAREKCLMLVGPFNCDGRVLNAYIEWER